MNRIVVNTESMGAAHKTSQTELQTLRQALKDMRASVQALNETWEGSNHEAFVASFETRMEAMEKLTESTETFLRSFDSASKAYVTCDSEVTGLASF